ncbi:MAG: hypothetical protein M1829_003395 [Trizodia sp. TS-e1964]|nr:MAG: hypothetical protein M1829_003395 [Trizodia sp. TS-e1964]
MPTYAAISGPTEHAESGTRPTSGASSSSSQRYHGRGRKELGLGGNASWISSVINLLNTILGAGVLAMPFALSQMGILLGTFVITWAALTAGFGLYLQIRCARYLERGKSSFFALSQITYPQAAVIFDAAIAVKCFGVGVSYLIIIGDLMPGVIHGFFSDVGQRGFLVERNFWITVFMLVIIPLAFLRRLDSLKYTSIVALISIGYLVILVIYHFFKGDTMADRGEVRVVKWAGLIQTLSSFPIVVFGYTCHQNMFSILNEISDNSPPRTAGVVVASIGSACSTYILVAITGYLSFGSNIHENIVGMYLPSVASTIAKAAIVVLVMFSYPLQAHPCRASTDAVLRWRPFKPHSPLPNHQGRSPSRTVPLLPPLKPSSAGKSPDSMSDLRFAVITSVIIILSYFVAMTVSSLGSVLAYVGSTGSTSISFILPGLFYYKISAPDSALHQKLLKEDDDDDEASEDGNGDDNGLLGGHSSTARPGQWRRHLLRKLSLALALYGIVVMVVCLYTNTFLR